MICESMRFAFITNAIADNYTGPGHLPKQRILELENGWGPVSGAVLDHDNCCTPFVEVHQRLKCTHDLRRSSMDGVNIHGLVAGFSTNQNTFHG